MTLGFLYVVFFSNPAFLLSFLVFISNHSLSWAIVSFTTWLISIDYTGLAVDLTTLSSGKSTRSQIFFRQILNTKNNQSLEEISDDTYKTWLPTRIKSNLWDEKDFFKPLVWLRKMQGFSSDFKKLRIYIRSFSEPPFDPVAKSYMSYSGTSFIFMPDHVSDHSSPFQRFKFYHELAHVSAHGLAAYKQKNLRILKYILFTSLVLVCCKLNLYIVVFLALTIILEVFRWFHHRIDFEMKADAFAISCIIKEERGQILERCITLWDSPKSPEELFRLKSLKKTIKSLEVKNDKLPSNVHWNQSYNPIEGIIYFLFIIYASQYATLIPTALATITCCALIIIHFAIRFYVSGKVRDIELSLESCISVIKS